VNYGGRETVCTLTDSVGATMTDVLGIWTFGDGAVILAHQSAGADAGKVFLYTVPLADLALATWTATRHATPVWTGMVAGPPSVSAAELLGVLYLACAEAMDAAGLYFQTRTWSGSALADLSAPNISSTPSASPRSSSTSGSSGGARATARRPGSGPRSCASAPRPPPRSRSPTR
jgi:hypothetical protein